MDPTEIIIKFERFMRRVNYSKSTIPTRFYTVKRFVEWLDVSIESVTSETIYDYIGYLHNKRLKARTINSYLDGIKRFYEYLYYEEKLIISNPVKPAYKQFLPKPLPRFLVEEEVALLFKCIENKRDLAMFMLMLRCGLRVGEVSNLTIPVIDFIRKRILVLNGKFRKDRIVYMSDDTVCALKNYLSM